MTLSSRPWWSYSKLVAWSLPSICAATLASADGVRLWASYLASWTAWNHVRTVAPLASTGLFAVALTL